MRRIMKLFRYIVAVILAVTVWMPLRAEEAAADSTAGGPGFNVQEVIFGHMSDAYEWHITDIGDKSVAIPLPVIVKSSTGWHVFSSKRIEHGEEYEGLYISEETGKIVEKNEAGEEIRPFDISITKNVLAIMISSALLVFLILGTARWYKKHDALKEAPRGLAAFMEPVIQMVDEGVAKDNIGEGYEKFSPYLCTVFLWILLNNILGIVPFFPGGANVTGNIAVTLVLAMCTFLAVNLFGNRHYWKDILWPDVPVFLKFPIPLIQLIEVFGIFTKPFSLMVRLFANILAGHAMILGLVSVIFIAAKMGPVICGSMTAVTMLFGVFMDCLELLVAFIQAYVFTMLSAVFIGMSREEAH